MEQKPDRRDLLIRAKLLEHLRNGGTSAREIHKELRGEMSVGTVERHLKELKKTRWADQTANQKWVPGPELIGLWEAVLAEEVGKAHTAAPIIIDKRTIRLLGKLLGTKKKVETFILSADDAVEVSNIRELESTE